MTHRFFTSVLTRVLHRLGLARLSELENAHRKTTAIRAAERERAAHEREAAARKLETIQTKLLEAIRERDAMEDRLALLHNAPASYRSRIIELRDRTAALETALDEARASARHHKALRGSATERLSALLPIRAATQADAATDASRESRLERCSADYADAATRWRAGSVPDGTRAVTIGGLRWSIPADQGDTGSLSRRIVEYGWLPLEDIAFVRQFVVGGVMLDVGANVGTTSITRVVLGDFRCAYCAEPNAANYLCLVGNVIDNGLRGRVLPDRVAVSSSEGVARLLHASTIGGHRLTAKPEGKAAERVTTVTLDAWLERLAVCAADVTFVKVDTQGWDLHVLQGAGNLLQLRRALWQIEVSPGMMKAAGSSMEDLCVLLQAHFTNVVVVGGAARPRPIADVAAVLESELGRRRFTNLLLMNTG
jgi:FkbM family methyltransferase